MQEDTIRLLTVCHSGAQMGVSSIDEVLPSVRDSELARLLRGSRHEHEVLGDEAESLLADYHRDGSAPSPIAKGMAWMKTSLKLSMDPGDDTVAGLITDGCHMGVKSLQESLNDCSDAEPRAVEITKRLIQLEDELAENLRSYL